MAHKKIIFVFFLCFLISSKGESAASLEDESTLEEGSNSDLSVVLSYESDPVSSKDKTARKIIAPTPMPSTGGSNSVVVETQESRESNNGSFEFIKPLESDNSHSIGISSPPVLPSLVMAGQVNLAALPLLEQYKYKKEKENEDDLSLGAKFLMNDLILKLTF